MMIEKARSCRKATVPTSFASARQAGYGQGLTAHAVRIGLSHDFHGGVALAEVEVRRGDLHGRAYIGPGGLVLLPDMLLGVGERSAASAAVAAAVMTLSAGVRSDGATA